VTRAAVAAVALALALTTVGCSGDDDPGSAGSTSQVTSPTGSIVPGGSTPSTPTTPGGPTRSSGPTGTGDPSAGIPLDQFCRGFREVRSAESAISIAIDDGDVTTFQTEFSRLTVAFQAMAETPPDEVADALLEVFFAYEEAAPKVASATSIAELTGIALQVQAGDGADDLETVRDFGSANC
jgi:hypothetical protein